MRKSWVVSAGALSIVCGILLRSINTSGLLILQIIAIVGVVFSVILYFYKQHHYRIDVRHRSRYFLFSVIALIPLGVLLGWLRVESVLLSGKENIPTSFTATIINEPDIREKNVRYHLDVEGISGDILLFNTHTPKYMFGDTLNVSCNLETPEVIEDFNYPGFLAKDNIYNLCYRASSITVLSQNNYPLYSPEGIIQRLITVRQHAKEIINRAVPHPSSSLITSLILGYKQDLPKNIQESFSQTGTSHIVAISGMHLMILSVILMRLGYVLKLTKKQSLVLSLGIIVLFIAMIGFKSSALRAGTFAAIALLAEFAQRPKNMFTVIVVTALAIVLYNPLLLVYDVGFSLSFAAVLGIIYIGPTIQTSLKWIPDKVNVIKVILSTTIAAQIAVTPLIMHTFGTVSLIATLANLLVVPVIAGLIGGGILVAITGVFSGTLASVIGILLDIVVRYVFFVVETLSSVPYASIGVPVSAIGMVSLYIVGLLLGTKQVRLFVKKAISWCVKKFKKPENSVEPHQEVFSETIDLQMFDEEFEQQDKKRPQKRFQNIVVAAAVVVVLIIGVGISLYSPTPQGVEIYMLDVGQGDAHLIRTPGNHTILIDGGPDSTVVEKLNKYMPATNKTIDLMILTHPHADHVTGLVEVLDQYTVERVVSTGVVYDTSIYNEWMHSIEAENIPFDIAIVTRSYTFETDTGNVQLEIIYPGSNLYGTEHDDVNETSVVVMLEYQDKKTLFTGDISITNEQEILDADINIQADILKVPHQGSDTSSSVEFLQAVNPTYAIIPVGEDNDFGHPSLRVLKRLERTEAQVFRTDIHGDIGFLIKNSEVILTKPSL